MTRISWNADPISAALLIAFTASAERSVAPWEILSHDFNLSRHVAGFLLGSLVEIALWWLKHGTRWMGCSWGFNGIWDMIQRQLRPGRSQNEGSPRWFNGEENHQPRDLGPSVFGTGLTSCPVFFQPDLGFVEATIRALNWYITWWNLVEEVYFWICWHWVIANDPSIGFAC